MSDPNDAQTNKSAQSARLPDLSDPIDAIDRILFYLPEASPLLLGDSMSRPWRWQLRSS